MSDDLEWGKEKLEKKARLRNINLYFSGETTKTDRRDRDRDRFKYSNFNIGLARYTCLNMKLFIINPIMNHPNNQISHFSIGHDLALMSLCNHTIISHGTFSFWSGYLAGGLVVRPEHFEKYR